MIGQVACAASPVLIFVHGTEIKPGAGGAVSSFCRSLSFFSVFAKRSTGASGEGCIRHSAPVKAGRRDAAVGRFVPSGSAMMLDALAQEVEFHEYGVLGNAV
jgi:hypothetical protein